MNTIDATPELAATHDWKDGQKVTFRLTGKKPPRGGNAHQRRTYRRKQPPWMTEQEFTVRVVPNTQGNKPPTYGRLINDDAYGRSC